MPANNGTAPLPQANQENRRLASLIGAPDEISASKEVSASPIVMLGVYQLKNVEMGVAEE